MLKYVHLIITAREGGDTSRRLALSRFSSPPRRGGTHTAPGDTGVQPNALLPQTLTSLSTNFTWLQQIKTSPAAILMSPRTCHRRQVGFIGIRGEGRGAAASVGSLLAARQGQVPLSFGLGLAFFALKPQTHGFTAKPAAPRTLLQPSPIFCSLLEKPGTNCPATSTSVFGAPRVHVAGVSAQLEPACCAFRLGEGSKTPELLLPYPVGQRGTVGDSWRDLHGHPDRSGGGHQSPCDGPGRRALPARD